MIIGLTGLNAAGKGTVAAALKARGFVYHSLSDTIRDVLAERGLPPTRENMIPTGNELRQKGGAGALAVGILTKIRPGERAIVDSVRTPEEVRVLCGTGRFVLFDVRASEAVRFGRIKARGRVGDPDDINTFRRHEQAELAGGPSGQQLLATAALADYVIDNSGSLEDLEAHLAPVLERLLGATSEG